MFAGWRPFVVLLLGGLLRFGDGGPEGGDGGGVFLGDFAEFGQNVGVVAGELGQRVNGQKKARASASFTSRTSTSTVASGSMLWRRWPSMSLRRPSGRR